MGVHQNAVGIGLPQRPVPQPYLLKPIQQNGPEVSTALYVFRELLSMLVSMKVAIGCWEALHFQIRKAWRTDIELRSVMC